jgi:hypothetical protein
MLDQHTKEQRRGVIFLCVSTDMPVDFFCVKTGSIYFLAYRLAISSTKSIGQPVVTAATANRRHCHR